MYHSFTQGVHSSTQSVPFCYNLYHSSTICTILLQSVPFFYAICTIYSICTIFLRNLYHPSKQSTLADVSLTSVQRQFNVELTLDWRQTGICQRRLFTGILLQSIPFFYNLYHFCTQPVPFLYITCTINILLRSLYHSSTQSVPFFYAICTILLHNLFHSPTGWFCSYVPSRIHQMFWGTDKQIIRMPTPAGACTATETSRNAFC